MFHITENSLSVLRDYLQTAQENYKKHADAHRLPSPSFTVGSKVYLRRKNIKTTRPSEKLDYRYIGPFEITEVINPVTYRLALPANSRIHNVFHVSLLEPFVSADPSRSLQPVPPVVFSDHFEYEVEAILDFELRDSVP